jgi:hypothetical protein
MMIIATDGSVKMPGIMARQNKSGPEPKSGAALFVSA